MKNLSFKKYQNYAKEKEQVHQWPHRPLKTHMGDTTQFVRKEGNPGADHLLGENVSCPFCPMPCRELRPPHLSVSDRPAFRCSHFASPPFPGTATAA